MQQRTSILLKLKQVLPVAIMCACLVFLTGINFFYYPPSENYCAYELEGENKPPQVPTEEKSSETKNLTQVQEEYIHDNHSGEQFLINQLSLHKIHRAEKLPSVYSDQVYSPPRA